MVKPTTNLVQGAVPMDSEGDYRSPDGSKVALIRCGSGIERGMHRPMVESMGCFARWWNPGEVFVYTTMHHLMFGDG